MSNRLILLSTATVLALGLQSIVTSAQTYRISAGVSPSGARCYLEVFEYDFVSEKPSFPGGERKLTEFINAHRHYPIEAYRNGEQGRVTCSFVVNTDGSVSHVKVIRSVSASLNEEAIRIFKLMPPWLPGKLNGQPVPVRVIRSIPFRK
ncbi:MAG: energy transducer TonB [Clostridium sp.]|nr:energy transducer TonB [Prevotella sp.]MCM1428320.1 energy transducer TonB [Clostridium sp.]MCM1474792.1 energy transducer TonB [Muribaculaceae bacterium]